MRNTTKHVWVVWMDLTDAQGGQGVVAVYQRKADAVRRVRTERRLASGQQYDPETEEEQSVRLSDWHMTDTPDVFSAQYQFDPVMVFEARRVRVE